MKNETTDKANLNTSALENQDLEQDKAKLFSNQGGQNHNAANQEKEKPSQKKLTENKVIKLLKNGGMIDAYEYLMENLCKNNLPKGDLFEYAAFTILNFEKKWKQIKSNDKKQKINKYWQEKEIKEKEKQEEELAANNKKKLNRSMDNNETELQKSISKKGVPQVSRSRSAKKNKKASNQDSKEMVEENANLNTVKTNEDANTSINKVTEEKNTKKTKK